MPCPSSRSIVVIQGTSCRNRGSCCASRAINERITSTACRIVAIH